MNLILSGNSSSIAEIIESNKFGFIKVELEMLCKRIMEENAGIVQEIIEKGKDKKIRYLVGLLMKDTGGKADAAKANECFKYLIDSVRAKKNFN